MQMVKLHACFALLLPHVYRFATETLQLKTTSQLQVAQGRRAHIQGMFKGRVRSRKLHDFTVDQQEWLTAR